METYIAAKDARVRSVPRAPLRRLASVAGAFYREIAAKRAGKPDSPADPDNLMDMIVAGSPVAEIVTDEVGVIRFMNPAAARLLACEPQEVVGVRTPLFLFDGDELRRRASVLSAELATSIAPGFAVLSAKPERCLVEDSAWRLRRLDGSWFDARVTVNALKSACGQSAGLLLVIDDLGTRQPDHKPAAEPHRDALTGLPTRWLFEQAFERALAAHATGRHQLAILLIDLDEVMHPDAALGPTQSDQLIQHAALLLRRFLRGSDFVARLEGEEFVVLLEGIPEPQAAEAAARKLGNALRAKLQLGAHTATTRASIGIAVYPDNGDTAEALLRHADLALQAAKAAGGDSFMAFSPELAPVLSRKRRIEMALREALARAEFRLGYMPQIALETGEVTGVEALLRWHARDLGEVAPAEFIPVAEATGLIEPIGEWVMQTACREGRALQRLLARDITIAVNLSARQFLKPGLMDFIFETMDQAELPAHSLELEITESMHMSEVPNALDMVKTARARGIKIAIDDFGTGFCSLSYITQFPIDRLKIDKSFIANIDTKEGRAVSHTIIALAHSLGVPAVAEGIETPAQHAALRAAGCDEGQGYLYGEAMPMAAAAARIRALGGLAVSASHA